MKNAKSEESTFHTECQRGAVMLEAALIWGKGSAFVSRHKEVQGSLIRVRFKARHGICVRRRALNVKEKGLTALK